MLLKWQDKKDVLLLSTIRWYGRNKEMLKKEKNLKCFLTAIRTCGVDNRDGIIVA